jgi:hypothetical protein
MDRDAGTGVEDGGPIQRPTIEPGQLLQIESPRVFLAFADAVVAPGAFGSAGAAAAAAERIVLRPGVRLPLTQDLGPGSRGRRLVLSRIGRHHGDIDQSRLVA